jgi:hypothetical protein
MSFGTILKEFITNFAQLLFLPFTNNDLLLLVLPLVLSMVIMFVYFKKYKEEELGWNSAVANSLVPLFVSIYLFRGIYNFTSPSTVLNLSIYLSRTVLVLVLFLSTFVLLFVNFGHKLPRKVAYFISSPISINLFCYTIAVFVYSKVDIGVITIINLVLLFLLLRFLIFSASGPLVNLFERLKKQKEEEEVKDLEELKKKIKKEKNVVKKREKKLRSTHKKKVEEQSKQLKKLRKAISK